MSRQILLRVGLVAAGAGLLVIGYRHSRGAAQAAEGRDPNMVWSIGKPDNSADEFGLGAARQVNYDAAKGRPDKDWRQRQDAALKDPPVYNISFDLDAPPPSPLLAVDCYFLDTPPDAVAVTVNGKRGYFRVRPVAAQNLDERQANDIKYSRAALRMPVNPGYLQRGHNRVGISFLGEGGYVYYDALWLARTGGDSKLTATVEPTIYFRRNGEQLKETTEIVINHSAPLETADITLKVGGATISKQESGGAYDFGEQVVEVRRPGAHGARALRSAGERRALPGRIPSRKALAHLCGLKIHNDIGFTDLQPNVEELDTRNIDSLMHIIQNSRSTNSTWKTAGWLTIICTTRSRCA